MAKDAEVQESNGRKRLRLRVAVHESGPEGVTHFFTVVYFGAGEEQARALSLARCGWRELGRSEPADACRQSPRDHRARVRPLAFGRRAVDGGKIGGRGRRRLGAPAGRLATARLRP